VHTSEEAKLSGIVPVVEGAVGVEGEALGEISAAPEGIGGIGGMLCRKLEARHSV
jgi:hypothetical protein